MAEQPKLLLGRGERLTSPIVIKKAPGPKKQPYTLDQAKEFLGPLAQKMVSALKNLPQAACPNDLAVATMTLHPAFLAKSWFPKELLEELSLTTVGSKAVKLTPRLWTKKGEPEEQVTTEIFVAGKRKDFARAEEVLHKVKPMSGLAEDVVKIELMRAPTQADRIKPSSSKNKDPYWEIVLHTGGKDFYKFILDGFERFLSTLQLEADLDRRIEVEGLCFVPMSAPRSEIEHIAQFSFLRAVREMPRLRQFHPTNSLSGNVSFRSNLPPAEAIDKSIKVAFFDGGFPKRSGIDKWATLHNPPSLGASHPTLDSHGLAVTSAFLFGPLQDGKTAATPIAKVDHYRVMDINSQNDPKHELYDVLGRIRDVLDKEKYDLVNLSLGPEIPIEDDDVHPWTATLDPYFSTGKTLAMVAVGNTGDSPDPLLARIQPPSDCVNTVAVGASDRRGAGWKRAPYSCVGPGRSPGIVKPDAVAFGGSAHERFWVLDAGNPHRTVNFDGTSVAAPLALRSAALLKGYFGDSLTMVGIKALLLHHADRNHGLDRAEVGWGRISENLEDLVFCNDSEVHIIYQGELMPGKWLRAPIPVPSGMVGKVEISATFCFVCATDPQHPIHYTRSGLEVAFRPHDRVFSKRKPGQAAAIHAKTDSFFGSASAGTAEHELRNDAHKWETVLSNSKSKLADSLHNPVFDIHYNARQAGQKSSGPVDKIPYALVVSISAPKTTGLYDKIFAQFKTHLEPLKPKIAIPIRT